MAGTTGLLKPIDTHAATTEALRAQLARAEAPRAAPRVTTGGLTGFLLRIPLVWKLVGANALIAASALTLVLLHEEAMLQTLVAMLVAGLTVSLTLVHFALQPLAELERTATRVWQGDLDARVPDSPLADRDMRRVGRTFNLLLDGLTADRARMRLLAAQVISAQDAERARLARDLHDSTAQTLAAAMLQLSAAIRRAGEDPALHASLGELRSLVSNALEEVRSMAHTIHPRVLDDLGLVAALEWMARTTRHEGLEVEVEAGVGAEAIPHAAASVLYRVAQESLRNAMQHGGASEVRIVLEADGARAALSVIDNGRGFDVPSAEARRPGMGLFSIRERVALVDGSVDIHSIPGSGTRVTATVPLGTRGHHE